MDWSWRSCGGGGGGGWTLPLDSFLVQAANMSDPTRTITANNNTYVLHCNPPAPSTSPVIGENRLHSIIFTFRSAIHEFHSRYLFGKDCIGNGA